MKTRFFFAAFMLLAVTGMQAQLNSLLTDASASFPNAAEKNIVRNYNDRYAVGYIVDNDTGYFYSASIDSFSVPSVVPLTAGYKIALDTGIVINDMKIFRDYTFFCGNKSLTTGIYGWFKTDDLCDGTIDSVYMFVVPPMCNLTKMVVTAGGTNVVAIGEYNSPIGQNCIVEIRNAMATPPIINYTMLLAVSNTQKQFLYDVLSVNNQVVFVGIDTNPFTNSFFIRKANSFGVLNDPVLSQVYYYSPTNNENIFPFFAPCAEVVSDYLIAVAHQSSSQGVNIAVSFIDLTLMNCISTHFLPHENRSELYEMRYIVNTDALILLCNPVSGNSDFLAFHPSSLSTYNSYKLSTSSKYTSLDLLNNQSFLSAGGSKEYMQRTSAMGPINPCISNTNLRIELSAYTKKITEQPLNPFPCGPFPANDPVDPVLTTITVNCSNYNK